MDDLTRIKGIGPAAAKRLAQAGIETFAHLAAIEDGEDSPAEQLGVKPAWIAEAAALHRAARTIPQEVVAEARSFGAGGFTGDTTDTQGKSPRPDHGSESPAEAGALPADGGAGDPQQDNPRGSSGTAREASSTGGGTTAETPSVGTQSGSPNLSSDTESMEIAAVTKLAGPHSLVVPSEIYEAGREMATSGAASEPPSLGAWLAFESLGEEEQLRRFPLTMAALRAWAVAVGRADLVAAGPVIRIAAKREGFRRAGLSHPKAPVEHLPEAFSPEQLEQLLGEPKLRVELV